MTDTRGSRQADEVATHWTMETVFNAAVDTGFADAESIDVSVRTELPMRGAERAERRGNRWYPTFINLEGRRWDVTLTPEQARTFAAALMQAADAADAADKPDTDVCGHWRPCDCATAIAYCLSEIQP